MELSQNRNWQLTKSSLEVLGLWPFQQTYFHILSRHVILIFITSILIPEVIKIISIWGDVDAVAECTPMFILHFQSIIKMLGYYIHMHKLKSILEDIQKDWQSNLSHTEMSIIQYYGENNRRIVHAYAWIITGCTITIVGTPFMQRFLDYVAPLNASRPIELLYSVKYFVDTEEYKIPIFIHAYLISPFPSLITIAVDTTYFHCIQHGCSMFAVVRHRMQLVANQVSAKMYEHVVIEQVHQLLRDCIKRHVITLQYCEKLESLHTGTLVPIIILNTLALSITGFHTLLRLDDPSEACKYGSYTCACVVHLFFYTYAGQDLIDYSESIHQFSYNTKWYSISPKLRKFFILTMMRSSKTCKITAGKLYIFSIENFSKVIKLSVSYFTVLLSFQ